MFSTYPPLPHVENLIEVIDSHDRPFLLMPKAEVLRQGFSHRGVLVAVRGGKGRFVVTKRPADAGAGNVWDLSAHTRIRAGESRLDAALRTLSVDAGMQAAQIFYGASKAPVFPAHNAFDRMQVTLFIADLASAPAPLTPSQASDQMYLDADELRGMNTHFPEMLSLALRWAVSSGALFPQARHPKDPMQGMLD